MIYDENETLGDHRSAMIRFAGNLASGRPIDVHKGSARGWMHISDAVKAIEMASNVKEYSVINIGHPEIVPITDLADMIRRELKAPKELVNYIDLPERMTLVKRPLLERQKNLLAVEPKVSLKDGVRMVCRSIQERLKTGEKINP